jgi:formate hydrogenlyase subunit 4
VKCRLQNRRPPPLVQPYRDLRRLFSKGKVLAHTASPVFRAAPYLVFGTTVIAASVIPLVALALPTAGIADAIVLVGLFALGRFFLALAGLDIGNSFGGMGSSREMTVAALAEPAMLMIVFTVSLVAGTTLLPAIAATLLTEPVGLRVSLGLGLIALVMVTLAENGRVPVDNPATHLELTMVHEAMALEYSGRHLALVEAAAMLKLALYLSVAAAVFVPWGIALPGAGVAAHAAGLALYLGKLAAGAALLAVFETGIAKMRLFRVADFLGGALLLAVLAVVLLFVSQSF